MGSGIGNLLPHKAVAKQVQGIIVPVLRKQLQGTDASDYRDTFIGGTNVTVALH